MEINKKDTEVKSESMADLADNVAKESIEQMVERLGSDHVPSFGRSFEGGIQIQQIPDEIGPCLRKIVELMSSNTDGKLPSPLHYLEIGAAAGGTTYLVNEVLRPDKIVLIDDNCHPKHHVRPYILRDIPHDEIIGHSQADGTVDVLKSSGLMFDIILIDGDHTYSGVKKDAEIYKNFLSPGGFMVFHDSAMIEWGVANVVMEMIKHDVDFDFVDEYRTSNKNLRPLGLALFRKRV